MPAENLQVVAQEPEIETFSPSPESVERSVDGDFRHRAIEKFCATRAVADAVLLQDEFVQKLVFGNGGIDEVTFQPRAEWSKGRGDSVHEVQFGDLSLCIADGKVVEVPVALKPFGQSDRYRAANELAALIKTPEETGISTFEPLGAIRTAKGLAIVTRFEAGVVSLDNIDWRHDLTSPLRRSFDIINGLQKGATLLARIHRAGITHNDAQVKNVAVDELDPMREVRLTDLETAKWRELLTTGGAERFMREVHRDIARLADTTLEKGLWEVNSRDDRIVAMGELLLEPYVGFLRHPANKTEAFTTEVSDEAVEEATSALREVLAA